MIKTNNKSVKTRKESHQTTLFQNRIKWITVKDTAKYLGRTENAIRILIYRGVLNSYKLGRRTYLRLSEIDSIIATSNLTDGGA